LTVNGLRGQLAVQVPAVQHVEQARNLELFKSKHNMGVKYVLEYHRGAVTPGPVQLTVNGLRGQLAVQHVDQACNLELFKFKYNMGAKYVLEYHKGTVTQSPVQEICLTVNVLLQVIVQTRIPNVYCLLNSMAF